MYREVALFMGDHGVDNIHLTVICIPECKKIEVYMCNIRWNTEENNAMPLGFSIERK
jgi:hypothetical protein